MESVIEKSERVFIHFFDCNQRIEKPKKRGLSSAQLKINSPEPKRKQKEDDSWLNEVFETAPPVGNDPRAAVADDDDDIIEIFPGPQAAVTDDDDDDDIIEIFPDRH